MSETSAEASTQVILKPPSVVPSPASRPRFSSPLEFSSPQQILMISLIGLVGLTAFSNQFRRADRRDLTGPIGSLRDAWLVEPIQINLNSAAESELNLLPGIGDKMAAELVAARNRIGGFCTWDDVASISGMGPATIAAIRPWCNLSPASGERSPLSLANH